MFCTKSGSPNHNLWRWKPANTETGTSCCARGGCCCSRSFGSLSVDRPSLGSFGSHLSSSFSVDRSAKEEELEELQRKVVFKQNMISALETLSVSRWKFMKKSWRTSESNTSLVWTHWREEREKGFEEYIAIIVNPNYTKLPCNKTV